ncbi:hypothetical protein INT48_000797 [Thamnidium elegans]|uniref:Uncharacterized protein n=1 Tax=Thamnidium elegans TaxID=101142 RepID=A0A8H7VYW7_9FUNG|nr:hypothetical protein INT48_000797 [Thamnidium elegans]
MSQHDTFSNPNVHGWLMDVPGYKENYGNETRHLLDIHEGDETRPCSLLSISSEDSINLEELISANYTADMDDETDLPDLSALDLDDSNEDFWKMDNFLTHLSMPTHPFSPPLSGKRSNRSKYQANDHEFITSLKLSSSYEEFDSPKMLQVPTSLPVSPKSLSSSPIDRQRMNRSGSMSSDNSLNSSSTITHHRHIYPSASTSTSSVGSHSTTNSYLPRTSSIEKSPRISTQTRYARPPTSLSETTNTRSQIGLARRATHIPAPASLTKKTISASPNRTQSTTLVHKKSNNSLTRSISRIGQPTRASHIPTAPRSTTSLGISSIFSPAQTPQSQSKDESRPKTSMGSSLKSPVRRAQSTLTPNSSKSTGLRIPTRKLYK